MSRILLTSIAIAAIAATLTFSTAEAAKKSNGGSSGVVSMITRMAPRHGVPVWFALRIAKVESGYNPRARGAAGELGLFQLKCQTARGLGFRGACSKLLDPATNATYGLKHLSIAIRSSKGNLKLAASKHNGGLGRKTLVRKYVAQVF
jgi:soluble lytic murein transglycosylase-like protein